MGQAELMGEDIYSLLQKKETLMKSGKPSLLGLAICRAIVDMFGGEFYMDSENDKKTVAAFWFPCEMKDIYKDL